MPLSVGQKTVLSAHFTAEDLDAAKVFVSDPLPISEPPFADVLRRFGFHFPSVALTSGITFGEVIACRDQLTIPLLFHELVHTVQYRLLGIEGFAYEYVRGFLASRSYEGIPLERMAYEFERRYSQRGDPFSVEHELKRHPDWPGSYSG